MPQSPVIHFENVSFSYNRGVSIIDKANITIRREESVCVVGPNGGGKTTLLKLILGLLKPEQGRVEVFGCDPRQARPRIGYMPQSLEFDPLFPITVFDVVLMGRLNSAGWVNRADRLAAGQALAEVELEPLAQRAFCELSGGERQRVLMARALASEPEMMLLDEPTANVDIAVENRMFEFLKRLNERMTILMVSHDLGFVSRLVDHVICVNRTVAVHPTASLNQTVLDELFGKDLKVVRHDHHCPEEEHHHG